MSYEFADDAATGDDRHELGALGLPGSPTGLSCPRCGGVLGERTAVQGIRLECRVRHVVALRRPPRGQEVSSRGCTVASVRALQEKAALTRRLSERADRQGDLASADQLRREASAADHRADVVRDVLVATEPAHDASDPKT